MDREVWRAAIHGVLKARILKWFSTPFSPVDHIMSDLFTMTCLTRNLFRKIKNTKGTFHAKMGSIKDRNGLDLTEAEDIKKRWQEYTEELYKKDLHNPDNHDGVITHLEPDILNVKLSGP